MTVVKNAVESGISSRLTGIQARHDLSELVHIEELLDNMVTQFVAGTKKCHEASIIACSGHEIILSCNAAVPPKCFIDLLQRAVISETIQRPSLSHKLTISGCRRFKSLGVPFI